MAMGCFLMHSSGTPNLPRRYIEGESMTKKREKELKEKIRNGGLSKPERIEWAKAHPQKGDAWAKRLYQMRKEYYEKHSTTRS